MEHRNLGGTDLSAGIIAFGGILLNKMEDGEAAATVAEAVERGVDYFDVAPSYGNAQAKLGPALAPYRKDVSLACKTGKRTAAEAREELNESLRLLRTDHFEVYQLHSLNTPEEIHAVFAPGGAMEVLLEAKRAGVARHIGFTCHYDEAALEILRRGEGAFSTMMFPVNFAYKTRKKGSLSALAACREAGLGVLAIKALAWRKWLDGEEKTYPNCWYHPIDNDRELARLALNDTLSQPPVAAAVSPGDKRMLRLALEIIEGQGGSSLWLNGMEQAALDRAAEEVYEVIF